MIIRIQFRPYQLPYNLLKPEYYNHALKLRLQPNKDVSWVLIFSTLLYQKSCSCLIAAHIRLLCCSIPLKIGFVDTFCILKHAWIRDSISVLTTRNSMRLKRFRGRRRRVNVNSPNSSKLWNLSLSRLVPKISKLVFSKCKNLAQKTSSIWQEICLPMRVC